MKQILVTVFVSGKAKLMFCGVDYNTYYIGNKCLVKCMLNDRVVTALWDTGAQVSIMSEEFLQTELPTSSIKNIHELLGLQETINLQAANGTPIPYCG